MAINQDLSLCKITIGIWHDKDNKNLSQIKYIRYSHLQTEYETTLWKVSTTLLLTSIFFSNSRDNITVITSSDSEYQLPANVMSTCFSTFTDLVEQTPVDVIVQTRNAIIRSIKKTETDV